MSDLDPEQHRQASDQMRAICMAAGDDKGQKHINALLDTFSVSYMHKETISNPHLAFRFGVLAGVEFVMQRSLTSVEEMANHIVTEDDMSESLLGNLGAASLVAATGPRWIRWVHGWVNKVYPRKLDDGEPLDEVASPVALVKELKDVISRIQAASGGRVQIATMDGEEGIEGLLDALKEVRAQTKGKAKGKGKAKKQNDDTDAPGMYL